MGGFEWIREASGHERFYPKYSVHADSMLSMKRGVPARDLISWGCINMTGSFKRTLYCELTVISKVREHTDCSARRCGPGDCDMFVTDTSARVPFTYT